MRSIVLVAAALLSLGSSACVRRVIVPSESRALPEKPPPGTVEIQAVSEDPRKVWELSVDGEGKVCSTPCTRWFPDSARFMLRSNRGEYLFLPYIGREAAKARRALLVAEGTHRGKRVNGIVFTTVGGMGVVTGIALTAVGCSNLEKRGGVCTAGLITGGVSLPLTAFAIWMLVDSAPKLHVLPVFETRIGREPVAVTVAPHGIVGTF